MKYVLVCEGKCNPNLKAIDDMVKTSPKGNNGNALLSEAEAGLVRSVKHTFHTLVAPSEAKCDECGARRRFGQEW